VVSSWQQLTPGALALVLLALSIAGAGALHAPEGPVPLVPLIPRNLERSEDVVAWFVERDDSVVIPDSVLAIPLSGGPPAADAALGRPSAANRNSNPLNIKLGSDTRWHVSAGEASISEILPLDGGRFLRFASAEAGFRAAVALLGAPRYRHLDVERALRRWSNNAYGAEIVSAGGIDGRAVLTALGAAELKALLAAMAAVEGYQSPTLAREIEKALGG
jgi:hypothetical protein